MAQTKKTTTPDAEQPLLVTIKELAKIIRRSESTIRRRINDGWIEAIQHGKNKSILLRRDAWERGAAAKLPPPSAIPPAKPAVDGLSTTSVKQMRPPESIAAWMKSKHYHGDSDASKR